MGTHSPRSLHLSPIALGSLVLVLCALVAATFDGPRWTDLDRGTERPPVAEQERDRSGAAEETRSEQSESTEDGDEPWLPWVPPLDLLLLVPTALVFGVALLVVARLRLVRRRRQLTGRMGVRSSPVPDPGRPSEDEESGLPEFLGEVARAIGRGTPRNAIVAAWVRLEQAVEGDHFPHRPEETPSELVERALASYHLDDASIRRLAALYREARFSRHPLTEQHRAEAAACLEGLLASLGARAR
ncbi:DUF4129 domain-containing protein [Nocardioides pelophilus]|uniref:DUF4129 domain-containing protein n=1 Tax=Nocardioides pelophilus TaxID=2172019 RepID=UPI001603F33F|nr:DUF4129 domain-containing protein [Nocardioides pelophilus]